jgi:hypothetical protein
MHEHRSMQFRNHEHARSTRSKKFNRGKPLKHARPWIKLFRRKGDNIMPQKQNRPIKIKN